MYMFGTSLVSSLGSDCFKRFDEVRPGQRGLLHPPCRRGISPEFVCRPGILDQALKLVFTCIRRCGYETYARFTLESNAAPGPLLFALGAFNRGLLPGYQLDSGANCGLFRGGTAGS